MTVAKKELIKRITKRMSDKHMRKPVAVPKTVFHIEDDNGNRKDFVVQGDNKFVKYTKEDVEALFDTYVEVIDEALRNGEGVTIPGYWSIGAKHKPSRRMYNVYAGELFDTEEKYVPHCVIGKRTKMAIEAYSISKLGCGRYTQTTDTDDRTINEEIDDGS